MAVRIITAQRVPPTFDDSNIVTRFRENPLCLWHLIHMVFSDCWKKKNKYAGTGKEI